MSTTARLDSQINKAAYLSAIVLFVFTAVSMFGVYDAPAGSTAAEKVAWLNENNGALFSAGPPRLSRYSHLQQFSLPHAGRFSALTPWPQYQAASF